MRTVSENAEREVVMKRMGSENGSWVGSWVSLQKGGDCSQALLCCSLASSVEEAILRQNSFANRRIR